MKRRVKVAAEPTKTKRKRFTKKAIDPPTPPPEEVKQLEELLASTPSEPIKVVEEVSAPAPKIKRRRAPSSYNKFVSEHIRSAEAMKLPPKERMGFVAQKWRAQKVSA
jgi:hypothetical protein